MLFHLSQTLQLCINNSFSLPFFQSVNFAPKKRLNIFYAIPPIPDFDIYCGCISLILGQSNFVKWEFESSHLHTTAEITFQHAPVKWIFYFNSKDLNIFLEIIDYLILFYLNFILHFMIVECTFYTDLKNGSDQGFNPLFYCIQSMIIYFQFHLTFIHFNAIFQYFEGWRQYVCFTER